MSADSTAELTTSKNLTKIMLPTSLKSSLCTGCFWSLVPLTSMDWMNLITDKGRCITHFSGDLKKLNTFANIIDRTNSLFNWTAPYGLPLPFVALLFTRAWRCFKPFQVLFSTGHCFQSLRNHSYLGTNENTEKSNKLVCDLTSSHDNLWGASFIRSKQFLDIPFSLFCRYSDLPQGTLYSSASSLREIVQSVNDNGDRQPGKRKWQGRQSHDLRKVQSLRWHLDKSFFHLSVCLRHLKEIDSRWTVDLICRPTPLKCVEKISL